ncbi:MAG: hypothetical protein ACM3SO_16705 [Betaproteobacteria bacterium]
MLRIPRALAVPAMLAVSLSASAAAPDTEAVEFYNTFINHYFVTATASEAQAIDSGSAGPGWQRTGRSYPAWIDKSAAPATAQPVCRFYSSGANSHFYTASASECAGLRQLEATERAQGGTVKGWQYEGVAFYIQAPAAGQCATGTVPISRAYNNGFANGAGSNHRFIDSTELQSLMADRSWIVEGVVMCSQPKSGTGTNANLAPTSSSFGSLAATWTGNAKWETETNGSESEASAPLTLTIDTSGAITGSGNGCTFTGNVTSGDGFRSLFKGTISATGCTNDSFNGSYQFLHLERFGTGTLMVDMKREAGPVEAKIEARLTTDTNVTPPAPTATGDFSSVAGDWTGTVGWIAKQEGKDGADDNRNAVNQALSLTITSAGAVSGSGFGCTVTGTLTTTKSGQAGFGGTITTTGCDNALFNATFNDVRVRAEDAGRIEIDFKSRTGSAVVEIEGTLVGASGGNTPPPPPPPTATLSSVTGSWEGNVTFLATARTTGGIVTPVRIDGEKLQLTINDDGSVTGSGLGCTLTGTVTFSDSQRHVSGGTITATGCSNALFNGVYNNIEMQLEDGRALEVQIRRQNSKDEGGDDEGNGTVKIFGTLARATP